MLKSDANKKTLDYVRRIVEKFYTDKGRPASLALWGLVDKWTYNQIDRTIEKELRPGWPENEPSPVRARQKVNAAGAK